MEITGTITQKLAKQSGKSANGEWQKQEFVITTDDQYPKTVCFSAFNNKVDALDNYKQGQKVEVHFNVSSREYNSKWYTELQMWKINAVGGEQVATAPQTQTNVQSNAYPKEDITNDLGF